MSNDYSHYSINEIKKLKKKYKIYFTKLNKNEIKCSSFFKKEKNNFEKIMIILYYSIIIYLLYSVYLIGCNQKKIFFDDSVIELKIKGYGYMNILSNEYYNLPNKIFINGINKTVQKIYYFENSENNIYNVSLMWISFINPSFSNMFKGCSNITEIDFFNFDTSEMIDIDSMFEGCTSLTHLNLSTLNTCNICKFDYMFRGCSSLISLDLSNFDVSRASGFDAILSGCSSLKYLDLSNFKTDQAIYSSNIFSGCTSLEFLNLKSASVFNLITNQINEFSLTNLTICSLSDIWKTNYPIIKEVYCYNNYLSDGIYNNDSYKCYSKQNSSIFSTYICEICGKNYYRLYNDINQIESGISCYNSNNSPVGYYLDKNDFLFKKCYESCKICEKGGNSTQHNCIECKNDYNYAINISNYKNCYDKFLNTKSFELTGTSYIQNIETDILDITHYHQTYNIYSNINSFSYIKSNMITNIIIEENMNINNKNESIKDLINILLDDINLIDINNGIDKKAKKNNLEFIFTSTDNQKNNFEKNNITMDLGQCEQNLKDKYGISENDTLYILQIISKEEGMKIPKIEYEIYYPLSNNLTKLNLSSCEGIKIEISISVDINDNLDKYNPKSVYYNDICSKAISDSGTDINLQDMQNEYIDKNMSLCEENCIFVEYNFTTKKAKCSCDIKMQLTENIKFNKSEFLKSFIEIKNIMNLNVMKCYKTVFKINDLLKNYGYFIISFIILFYLFCVLIFSCYSFNKLRKEIKNIVFALKYAKSKKINNNFLFNQKKFINNNYKINFKKQNAKE